MSACKCTNGHIVLNIYSGGFEVKAVAFEHYPTGFSELGSEAGTSLEGAVAWPPAHPQASLGLGRSDSTARAPTETQKGLGGGPVCRLSGLPQAGSVRPGRCSDKEDLPFSLLMRHEKPQVQGGRRVEVMPRVSRQGSGRRTGGELSMMRDKLPPSPSSRGAACGD